ncbi:MAG: Com family DNA-binding transcriptional regulator [Syntrophomonadaceae bacterium]|nr:Com family DNA-binding transcriptional regulator [Syntrophomonadaceae bacterium]
MTDFRCQGCQKLLGKYRECEELEIKCPRCGLTNSLKKKEKSGLRVFCSPRVLESMVNSPG